MDKSNGQRDEQVLLTGGSGFIASHVLDALLDAGFQVTVTARSEEKGSRIVESVKPYHLSYAVVEDIAKEGAFDKVFQSAAPFAYVVHTASPYHVDVQDPVKDFLDPAIKGTTELLKSIKAHGPTVKRLVITSSSAAILNPNNHPKVYDETYWAPTTWEDAIADPPKNAYRASKVFSEKAAWAFIENEKPNFDLAVINSTFVFGPIQRKLPSLDDMNASNHRIRDMMQGKMKDALQPTAPVFTFVDVRDVALAHLRAMTVPEAGGNRFYVVGGHFANKDIADVIQERFPALQSRLPAHTESDLPDDVYKFNNRKSREILGINYKGLEESVIPNTVLPRQITLTQTITYADYTTTAVVTLGRGGPPTAAAAAPTAGALPATPDASSGLSSSQIGIIVGSVLGAVVVALLIWLCCVIRRRMIEQDGDGESEYTVTSSEMREGQTFRRPFIWPRFPQSIPPPPEPTYWARPPGMAYTANGAAHRATSSYVYYDSQLRRQ
ncbi:hypothetical protein F5Y19DRAFT_463347 [Xylariaceae sp. FL1651]|nr:hypothetical protein F5Y19DRAFT_463347 [Xylariaceae sp. FL1651]